MKLILKDHEYKYAVEQIQLTMFPEERPEFTDGPVPEGENCGTVSLSYGEKYATAVTMLNVDGKTARGSARAAAEKLTDRFESDRLLQKIIKQSFFRAAVKLTGRRPVWGSLTGIRPGKLAANMMEKGMTEAEVRTALLKDYCVEPRRTELCLEAANAGLALKKSLTDRDIAMYAGIPFCPTRCAYCSFVSHSVEKSMKLVEPFLGALEREIAATAAIVRELGLRTRSLYMGGGTPTTLDSHQLHRLFTCLETNFDLHAMTEFCVEAGRPDTIDEDKLKVMKAHGVNRISINPQTMSDEVLKAIGRRHTKDDILRAFDLAAKVGFDVVNMDLIAGLPADSAEGFRATLDEVMALSPENITVHTLSLKKGSRITLEGTPIPDDKDVGDMLDYSLEKLSGAGYVPYYLYRQKFMSGGFENIGWSKPGTESFYNIAIMEELCSIIAMGGGASTKLVAQETGKIERIFNAKYPYEYIDGIDRIVSAKDYIKDFYGKEVHL
ncbi:MAG: coproporphyrinogen dehydrogenase HemZ [Oscillospiraceae bacterium]|nr:coproporphyrinogen dehydrogenase HemZ [Oscillospiraceae bacterium]